MISNLLSCRPWLIITRSCTHCRGDLQGIRVLVDDSLGYRTRYDTSWSTTLSWSPTSALSAHLSPLGSHFVSCGRHSICRGPWLTKLWSMSYQVIYHNLSSHGLWHINCVPQVIGSIIYNIAKFWLLWQPSWIFHPLTAYKRENDS